MTGSLLVCAPELELEKHTHAVLQLSSGRELRFVDPRRFGRLRVIEKFEAPGRRAAANRVRRFRGAVSRPQDAHQERTAEPIPAERRGKYLRR